MGITGLLPLLKSIMLPIHIKDLQGSCVAIDTYSWLHKGALSCSKDLCKGLPTSKHIDYCMHRVNLLRHHGIKPILVFDGGFLPMKSDQENKRGRSRKENLARAIEHESNGNLSAAYECYQKAVDVSPLMAFQLIQVLKQENISYVVAPYEADAQMTFLALSKQVDAVITEDSDLIAFGCPRIIYKMDKFGQGVEFCYSKLQQNKELNFTGFTKQMILEMCILSGCDYLQSLPGMGLKKAHALIKKFKTYDKVIKHLKYNSVAVTPLYEESFKKAIMTFQHQRVYDPISKDIVHLTELSDSDSVDFDFLGPLLPQDVATGIALGDIDPFTKLPFQVENSDAELAIITTYQNKKLKPESERKKLDLPAQKNLLTNYFCSATLEAKRNFKAPRITPPQESPVICLSDTEDQIVGSTSTNEIDGSRLGLLHNSIHKPCTVLHQERVSHLINDKIIPEKESSYISDNGNEIVRSSYFQQKIIKENDCLNKNDEQLDKDVDAFMLKYSRKRTNGSKLKLSNNKLPVKSSYFQKDSIEKDTQEDEVLSCEENDNNNNNIEKRRKVTPSNLDEKNDGDNGGDMKGEEGKFGCDISHLNHYSKVAEKSMDNFVSVISSFKFTSMGSRASGLRAPLKDIRNTCEKRLSGNIELSKYTYVPTKQKANFIRKV